MEARQRGKAKRQGKETRQRGKAKRQGKEARQSGKAKRQGKEAENGGQDESASWYSILIASRAASRVAAAARRLPQLTHLLSAHSHIA